MTRRDLIVAVDAGTSVVKALAFDLDGQQVAAAARPNRYDDQGAAVTQDMAQTWADCRDVLRDLGAALSGLDRRAAALAVTGQGDGTWLVDAAGEPVAPAWLWLDSRAAGLVEALVADGTAQALYGLTGCGLNACSQAMHLLWLARHQPALLDRAATALHCKDWLYLKLTGERATDPSEGLFTFGDLRARRYAPEILDRLGLATQRRLLPELLDGSVVTHPLTPAAAAETGLPAGLPVSLGAVDVVCTALGGGLTVPGPDGAPVGCSVLGSTAMHMRLVPDLARWEAPAEAGGYTMALPGTLPGPPAAARMQSTMAATLNIDWLVAVGREAAGLLGAASTPRDALAAFDARVLTARPGAALYHPYIHEAGERGPFVNAAARAQFAGLSRRAGFLDLMRALYEGIALAARDCYAAAGPLPQEMRLTGGAARSAALSQILASVLGAPVRRIEREECGAAGAAMMAAVAIGALPDLDAAAQRWVAPTLGAALPPDPALQPLYDRLFPLYVAARQAMAPLWAPLAQITKDPS